MIMDITFYSYFNNMLTSEGIEKTLSYAVERGFTAVEFLDVPTVKRIPNKEYAYELKNALDRYGLKCACYSVGGNILAEEGGMYGDKNGVDTFKQSAEYAAILGSPYFHHTMTIGYNNTKKNPDTFDTLSTVSLKPTRRSASMQTLSVLPFFTSRRDVLSTALKTSDVSTRRWRAAVLR